MDRRIQAMLAEGRPTAIKMGTQASTLRSLRIHSHLKQLQQLGRTPKEESTKTE